MVTNVAAIQQSEAALARLKDAARRYGYDDAKYWVLNAGNSHKGIPHKHAIRKGLQTVDCFAFGDPELGPHHAAAARTMDAYRAGMDFIKNGPAQEDQ